MFAASAYGFSGRSWIRSGCRKRRREWKEVKSMQFTAFFTRLKVFRRLQLQPIVHEQLNYELCFVNYCELRSVQARRMSCGPIAWSQQREISFDRVPEGVKTCCVVDSGTSRRGDDKGDNHHTSCSCCQQRFKRRKRGDKIHRLFV
uniref:Uncharacterized protein n=1 Tax=Timema douglasi TaxID=61478 RepID=A0A7R8VTU7_TIMDO|nr:unnamed protein product [Timema douglasi]